MLFSKGKSMVIDNFFHFTFSRRKVKITILIPNCLKTKIFEFTKVKQQYSLYCEMISLSWMVFLILFFLKLRIALIPYFPDSESFPYPPVFHFLRSSFSWRLLLMSFHHLVSPFSLFQSRKLEDQYYDDIFIWNCLLLNLW